MAKTKNDIDTTLSIQEGDLGKLLAKLRESIGYSIPQTADAMCLSEDMLVKLESEAFDSLPEPPYIRGYLRNYAKLADKDSDDLIACYESLRGADPKDINYHFKSSATIHAKQKKSISPVLMQLIFLGVLLSGLFALTAIPAVNQWIKTTWDSFSAQAGNSTDNPLLTGNMPTLTPAPEDAITTDNKPETTTPTKNTPLELLSEASVTSNPQITVTEKSPTQDDIPEPASNNTKPLENSSEANSKSIKVGEENLNEALIPASNDGSINIKLVFNNEVWMRIKDREKKTVFEGQNASGQEKKLQLKKPLTFRVGNAQGLSLFVDDKLVDISHYIKGSVANFTLE